VSDEELSKGFAAMFDVIYKFMNRSVMHAFGVDFTLWQLFLLSMLVGVIFWAWHELTD